MKTVKALFFILLITILPYFQSFAQIGADTIRTVKMTALASTQPLSLTIEWKDDPGVNTYELYRKLREDSSWGTPIVSSGDQDFSYVDTDIEEGNLYEYQIIKTTGDSLGYAYLLSGVNYTPPQQRGDVLLLVDSTAAIFAADNLNTYMEVLTSEGWIPWMVPVSVDASVPEVKNIILDYHQTVDSLTAVILMGDIITPHSGNIYPDNHINHQGAWPADVYYGDVDGIWTDSIVDNTASAFPRVHNVPGDGNFDQDFIPGQLELAIGRLDFSELPVFDLNEYELLDRYLEKNIEFRTGEYQTRRRAIFTNYNPWSEGLGQNAIRNFVPIVSNDSLTYGNIADAWQNPYLWSYFGSSGYMMGANGLGTSASFSENNFQATFTASFGSTYGDYDFENNFLRSVVASGRTLSTAWVGAPNWHFYPMGMGMDLGYCALLTQNNTDLYYPGLFAQYITINLIGDPTLKAFIIRPPSDLNVVQNGNHNELDWSASPDDIIGYQVYKKTEGMSYFEVLNEVPITSLSYVDSCIVGGTEIKYLVKAVKQEITASGSFINHSNGPIATILTEANILPQSDFNLSWEAGTLTASNQSTNADQYQWILPDGSFSTEIDINISYSQGGDVSIILISTNDCFSDTLQQSLFITSTDDPFNQQKIKIYPNPAKDFVSLETSTNIDQLQINNLLGSTIATHSNLSSGTHTFNVQNIAGGVYVMKIQIGSDLITKLIFLDKN